MGRALADELGWAFRDFDREIEARAGMSVPEIFGQFGEAHFRELEAAVAGDLLLLDRAVLASGGGWPCARGRLEGLDDRTLAVWLRVGPETAVARVARGGDGRPLLSMPEPAVRARELLELRRKYYEKASWSMDGEAGTPEGIAGRLADRLRTDPERPLRE